MKKIVICIPNLNIFGGTEIQTLLLSHLLVSRGFTVIIFCYFLTDERVVARFTDLDIAVERLGLRKNHTVSFVRALTHHFKKIKPDLVHVQYVAPGLLPIIAARFAGINNLFATVHQPCRAHGWKAKYLLRFGALLCNAFFCVAENTERSWFGDSAIFDSGKSNVGRKHFTVYNGVDVEKIEKICKETDSEAVKKSLGIEGKKVVGVIGRLRWEKGQKALLDAMAEVIKTVPDATLLVVGDGPDRMSLEQRAISLGLADHILWFGQKSPEEVFLLCSIMDVVAVPSVFEGFGLSATEAMAAGRPVVASDVDGLSEIVEGGVTGYLISPNKKEEFASRIAELLSSLERANKMGKAGRKRVKTMFSAENFADSMISAYRRFQMDKIF